MCTGCVWEPHCRWAVAIAAIWHACLNVTFGRRDSHFLRGTLVLAFGTCTPPSQVSKTPKGYPDIRLSNVEIELGPLRTWRFTVWHLNTHFLDP